MSIENYAKSSQFYQVQVHKQQVQKCRLFYAGLCYVKTEVIFNATSPY